MKESYCGLCHKCPLANSDFLDAIAKVKSYLWDTSLYWWFNCLSESRGFSLSEFLKGLDWFLTHPECPGCKEGGGQNQCPIRLCASQRQYTHCNECPDFQTCVHYTLLEIMKLKKSQESSHSD